MGAAAKLPRIARLRRPREFKRTFAAGRRLTRPPFGLVYLRREGNSGDARVGLAISKKFVPKAVLRNRVKRLVREGFRLRRRQLPPGDVVIYAMARVDRLGPRELNAALEALWARLEKL